MLSLRANPRPHGTPVGQLCAWHQSMTINKPPGPQSFETLPFYGGYENRPPRNRLRSTVLRSVEDVTHSCEEKQESRRERMALDGLIREDSLEKDLIWLLQIVPGERLLYRTQSIHGIGARSGMRKKE